MRIWLRIFLFIIYRRGTVKNAIIAIERKTIQLFGAVCALVLLMLGQVTFGGSIFVGADATGANDGSSWEDAFNYLQDALAVASAGDEVLVAQGIYKPDQDTAHPDGTGDREATFLLINDVAIYGGYAGFGEPDPDARNVELYETILSGDIDNNGVLDDGNVYHVVSQVSSTIGALAKLDGFAITGGHASGPNPHYKGGGIYIQDASPVITNCKITDNNARWGLGIFVGSGSNPVIRNCLITGNGIHIYEGAGGGIACVLGGSPTVVDCIINGNTARSGGGIYCILGSGPTFINCIISGNTGSVGGGMRNIESNPVFYNCNIVGNSAGASGGGFENIDGSPELTNCIIWGNSPYGIAYYWDDNALINYSNVQGGWPGTANIDFDPGFVDPNGADGILGTEDDDLRLLSDSPCIDSGDPNFVADPNATDLDGNRRIVNGRIDMGAYEAQPDDPIELLGMLADDVIELVQYDGLANSLLAKIDTAIGILEDGNDKNDKAAVNSLKALINAIQAQSGEKISQEEASELIENARIIIEMLRK
jgi:hypothetical protein